jgi:hypothetical protein
MMIHKRELFTDGWNSYWHLLFGALSVIYIIIIPIFCIYQLIDYNDANLFVDLAEFIIGFITGFIIIVTFVLQYAIQNEQLENY